MRDFFANLFANLVNRIIVGLLVYGTILGILQLWRPGP